MAVTAQWIDGFETRTRVAGAGHELTGDEPEGAGGGGRGPTPFDFLLTGLATCTVVTVAGEAQLLGVDLDDLRVEVKHKQNRLVRGPADPQQRGLEITEFRRHITVAGEMTGEQQERLLWAAEHCPVSTTLSRGVSVTTRLERVDRREAPDRPG